MLKSNNIKILTLKRFSLKIMHRLSQSFYIITVFQSIVLYSNKILLRYLCTKEELNFKVKLKVNLFVLRFLRTKLSLLYQKNVKKLNLSSPSTSRMPSSAMSLKSSLSSVKGPGNYRDKKMEVKLMHFLDFYQQN